MRTPRSLVRWLLPACAAVALLVGAGAASASTASTHPVHAVRVAPASSSTTPPRYTPHIPHHIITCSVTPEVPTQNQRGGVVVGFAHVVCTPLPPPDICSVTVRVWRYDATQKKYYLLSENTSNECGADGNWYVATTHNCIAQNPWAMHTEVNAQFFHGNWITIGPLNSSAVTLYC